MFAGLCHCDADFTVQEVRGRDAHRVDGRIGCDIAPILGESFETELVRRFLPSARHLVGDGGQADHGKLGIVLPQTQIRLRVDAAHPSESGNCY